MKDERSRELSNGNKWGDAKGKEMEKKAIEFQFILLKQALGRMMKRG